MLLLKCCPRCRGDLHEDTDVYGRFVNCLQCGFYMDGDASRLNGHVHHQPSPDLADVPAEILERWG